MSRGMFDGLDMPSPGGRGMFEGLGPAQAMPQPGAQQKGGDIDSGIMQLGQEMGIDPQQFPSPEAFLDALWSKSPTDAVGEAIEMYSKKHGLAPPWERQQEPQQAAQPQMPGGAMPPTMGQPGGLFGGGR